ncbi:hypothetical protein [Micromonospora sp. DT233]|uniref:hypothetical protein n=1 Tax=Micromonospora sp. DT233 TaxID=3393432 RepID=UPI003CE75E2E
MTDYPALHGPSRPGWRCIACDAPWPCPTRKHQLRELCQGNLPALVRYLSAYLSDAQQEISDATTADLTDRFLGWCARPPDPTAVQEHPPTQQLKTVAPAATQTPPEGRTT